VSGSPLLQETGIAIFVSEGVAQGGLLGSNVCPNNTRNCATGNCEAAAKLPSECAALQAEFFSRPFSARMRLPPKILRAVIGATL